MTAKSTRGVRIDMVTGGAGLTLTPTSVTKADPAILTVTDATGVNLNDILSFAPDSTGLSELDGKTWVVELINGNEITLLGSNTANSNDVFAAGAGIEVFTSIDMTRLCWSSMTFNPDTPETVSVGTYCDPTATLPGSTASAGTLDFTGYVDIEAADYPAMLEAWEDGTEQIFRVTLPNNGVLMFNGVISALNLDIPIDGATAYTGQVALSSRPRHLF